MTAPRGDDSRALIVCCEEDLYRDKKHTCLRLKKNATMSFRVNSETKLSTLMTAYCTHQSLLPQSLVFTFAGCSLKETDTVRSLYLKKQDIIYVRHSELWSAPFGKITPSMLTEDLREFYHDINPNDSGLGHSPSFATRTADVKFLVGPNEDVLSAHKAIICARSKKMKAMFMPHTAEGKSGEVRIPNHSKFVFSLMLEFIYCGEFDRSVFQKQLSNSRHSQKSSVSLDIKPPVSLGTNASPSASTSSTGDTLNISDSAFDYEYRYHCDLPLQLLALADEFLLSRLAQQVEMYLIETCIDSKQVIACFCGADKYRAVALKRICKQYILDNFEAVCEREQCLAELKRCPELLLEITINAVDALRPIKKRRKENNERFGPEDANE